MDIIHLIFYFYIIYIYNYLFIYTTKFDKVVYRQYYDLTQRPCT